MDKRIAIIVSGRTRNFPMTLKNFMDNIVVPNNADVFILFQRNTRLTCDHVPIPNNDMKHIKKVLGKNLKHISFTDDDYDKEFSETMEACNRNIQDLMIPPSQLRHNILDNKISPYPIDQYLKIRKIAIILEEYEKKNNIKYDIVVRSRIDHIFYENKIELNGHLGKVLTNNGEYFFVATRDNIEMPNIFWASELLVFGTHDIMLKILKNFIYQYGKFRLGEGKRNQFENIILAQEIQFGLYLNQFYGECSMYKLTGYHAHKDTGCSGCSHYSAKIE
jgi:hypothetical protein